MIIKNNSFIGTLKHSKLATVWVVFEACQDDLKLNGGRGKLDNSSEFTIDFYWKLLAVFSCVFQFVMISRNVFREPSQLIDIDRHI
jgi:hypothetical protein